jgi:TorA maturation chaperone TorD
MITTSFEVLEDERSDIYKLLSECFYQPDEKLLNTLNSLDSSAGGLASLFADMAFPLSEIDSIKIDYAKLFIGPYKMLVPPYGSLYIENGHRLMGDSTMEVLNFYNNEVLDLNLKDAPDHITMELEFMYFLIYKETEAKRKNNLKNAELYHKKQEAFWKMHLSLWIHAFVKNIEKHACTEFYKKLGYLLGIFFISEDKYFNSH